MRVVFLGTSEFAIPSLRSLNRSKNHNIEFVITQPDSPQGRGLKVLPSPVKIEALKKTIPVIQPGKITSSVIRNIISESKADIIFCAAYGEFLPETILGSLPFGAINLHPSRLPLYRGAAPVQRALMEGCDEIAVTFIQMAREMDAGDILLQKKLIILPEETAGDLLIRTAELGGDLLPGLLDDLEEGKIVPIRQDHTKATFAPVVKKDEGLIDWNYSAEQIFNLWRGLTPKPGLYSFLGSKRFIFTKLCLPQGGPVSRKSPGTAILEKDKLLIATGDGRSIEILEIKPEGRASMNAVQFANGYKPAGMKFSGCS
jgi:methionyl-tRNA formyltransferase